MSREEFIIAELDRRLTPNVLDGSESFTILADLTRAIRDADGDLVRIDAALLVAQRRMSAITSNTVPLEIVHDVVCRVMENCNGWQAFEKQGRENRAHRAFAW